MAPVSIPARGQPDSDADLFIPPRHQRDPIDRAPTTGAHRGEHGFRPEEPLHPGERPSRPLVMLPIRSPEPVLDVPGTDRFDWLQDQLDDGSRSLNL